MNEPTTVFFYCREPWKWVFNSIREENQQMIEVKSYNQLPSRENVVLSRRNKKDYREISSLSRHYGATLIIEDSSKSFKCVSGAFDLVDSKDLLFHTLSRAGLSFCMPPSISIKWNESNVEESSFPVVIKSNCNYKNVWVLKSALGSQGNGIHFIQNSMELMAIINDEAKNIYLHPDILREVLEKYNRIPEWVLQAQVPSLMVRNNKKMHLRAYVVAIESLEGIKLFYYNKFEVRIAGSTFDKYNHNNRDSHITNGAGKDFTERCLSEEVEELEGIEDELYAFIRSVFEKLKPELMIGVNLALVGDKIRLEKENNVSSEISEPETRFAFCGIDIMVGDTWRKKNKETLKEISSPFFILEVNRNPASPPASVISNKFKVHLKKLAQDLIDLVTNKKEIIGKNGFY